MSEQKKNNNYPQSDPSRTYSSDKKDQQSENRSQNRSENKKDQQSKN